MKASMKNMEYNIFLALDLNNLWCERSHRVRFYVYIHANVNIYKLRNLRRVNASSNVEQKQRSFSCKKNEAKFSPGASLFLGTGRSVSRATHSSAEQNKDVDSETIEEKRPPKSSGLRVRCGAGLREPNTPL